MFCVGKSCYSVSLQKSLTCETQTFNNQIKKKSGLGGRSSEYPRQSEKQMKDVLKVHAE